MTSELLADEKAPRPAVPPARSRLSRAQPDHWLVRWAVILLAVGSVGVLVILPVVYVFWQALANGFGAYWDNLFGDRDTAHAIMLTLIVAPMSVALNVVFGVAAAWAIARFK